jgi:hypothetical protein
MSDGCCPTHGGEAGERSETEGADCVAIGDWGIFEKSNKQLKVKSEDFDKLNNSLSPSSLQRKKKIS